MSECAMTDCTKEAMGDRPRLCPEHFLTFIKTFNAIREDRINRERASTNQETPEEGQ